MRKNYTSEFKAKAVLEVLREAKKLNEIADELDVHPNMLSRWKNEAIKKLCMLEAITGGYSVAEQCELLSLNRTSLYYKPVPVSEKKLEIMNSIDEIYTEDPAFGGATIGTILQREGL